MLPEPEEGQVVDFYIVSVGTDRRYANTRNDVVPDTYVGRNTSVMFENLELVAATSVYYMTVKAYSTSSSTATVTSNGMTPGADSRITRKLYI